MIPVAQQPEYAGFDLEVRRPGAEFLATCPNPNSEQFRKKNYWSKAAKNLHAAYSGICAYTAMYLPEQGTVDHFHPKTTHPQLAYEWSNYRLASGRVNNIKSNQTGLLDPFQIQDGWFHLDIPSCVLRADASLDKALRTQISNTINGLRLNSDDNLVQERANILIMYADGLITFGFLQLRYPLLAKELARQNLSQAELRVRFKREVPASEQGQQ